MAKKAEIVKPANTSIQPFKLTADEANSLISQGGSQFVIPSGYNFGGATPLM